jgi:cytoskeleton protein RodZ
VESLGARLKREREKRKITLDEISLSTKIGTRFLVAIEEEHFDQLPGGIFNKGFVKAYARSVGVDEAEAIAEYELASGASLPESLPEDGPLAAVPAVSNPAFLDEDPDNGASRIPWGWFAIALLIVAFGLAVWGFVSREKSAKPSVISPPPAATDGSSAAAPSIVGLTVVAQTGLAPTAPAPLASKVANASQPLDSKAAAGGLPTAAPTAASSTVGEGAFLVQIKAREDSWVAISADGRQIMQAMLYASAEKSIGAHDQIVIKTGNAGALDISFNGKMLPTQGAYNQVKTITFDPNGPKL